MEQENQPIEAVPTPIIPGLTPVEFTDEELAAMQRDFEVYCLEQEPEGKRLLGLEILPDKELPEQSFLFEMQGVPCFPRGELVAVSGKAKSGKSYFCSALMVAALSGTCLGIRRRESRPLQVLWIDTEQSDQSTQDILCQRILPLQGDSPLVPRVFNLRKISWQDRQPLVEMSIRMAQPDLVVLDGIRDLVNDINNGPLAQTVVEALMRIAEANHCCMACVLHQNKRPEDETLRGAIGTELMNKAFEAYECKKTLERLFEVKQVATRKYDMYGTLCFTVNQAGLPEQSGAVVSSSAAPASPAPSPYFFQKKDGSGWNVSYYRLFHDMFTGGKVLQPTDMLVDARSRIPHMSEHWLNTLIQSALQRQLLERVPSPDGLVAYRLCTTPNMQRAQAPKAAFTILKAPIHRRKRKKEKEAPLMLWQKYEQQVPLSTFKALYPCATDSIFAY